MKEDPVQPKINKSKKLFLNHLGGLMPFNTGTGKERHSEAGVPRNQAAYAP